MDEVKAMINDMEKKQIIEPSSSPWSSPIVLVKKKDGSTRFCVDYRKLNMVTKKDSYPLPRIDDTIDAIAGSKWFSTLDLQSGYWQVEMSPEDKEKTAFSTWAGLWQFRVMPFGLCNAPTTFERLMERVLSGLSWKVALVYLDDIIVPGKTFEEENNRLRQIFTRLREANLKLNPKKCHLFQKNTRYLGHIVSAEGVRTDPEKTEAVENWKTPSNKHELRSFLGLCSYYRKFVKGFSSIAKPLHRLTENKQPYEWSNECQEAFIKLKTSLTTTPVLAYPSEDDIFYLDTDASDEGIGAVLSQMQDSEEKVIAYYSRSLGKAERNYCVTRKELLSVVKAVDHFHPYLYGRHFVLRTDHAALKWLMNFKNPEGQTARWVEKLQSYDFEVIHRPGKHHQNADAMSRRPCEDGCKHCNREEETEASVKLTKIEEFVDDYRCLSLEQFRKSQHDDPTLRDIIGWLQQGERPAWVDITDKDPILKSYIAQWNSLSIRNDILYRMWENVDGTKSTEKLVVPKELQRDLIRQVHDENTGGHFGINKTLEKLRERFYWVGCRNDVENYCRTCDVCLSKRGPNTRGHGKMQQYNVGAPFERIAIDILGPLPETDRGNKYLLVVMDYFTKWPEAIPIPNQEAGTVADALLQSLVSRFGVPMELHSDQGRNFESDIFQSLMKLLGTYKTRTTPLHPQSDGMVERFNSTILNYLAKYVD